MKLFKRITVGTSALGLVVAMLVSFGGVASAACWQYTGNTMTTSKTPVFNNICNVPNGTGNESNFVKIRPNTTGDPTSTANNAAYVDAVNSVCDNGDKFDIHTYIHNDAQPDANGNGSGTAVAHGVQLSLAAALGSTNSNFTFGSTVTATNAGTVSDTATLNCSGGPVKLTLVPGTVKVYGTQYNWTGLPDNSVNGTFKIGSPIINSGDVWGCWQYRIVVVYEVNVEKIVTPPPVTATCDLFSITATDDRRIRVSQFKYTATNANFKNVVVDWGDKSENLTLTNGSELVGQTHQFKEDGTYSITAVVTFGVNGGKPDIVSGGAGTACAQSVTFKPGEQPKIVTITTPPSTTTVTTPSQLVNTGAGSVVGIFGATTAIGAAAYRRILSRRLDD